SDARLLPAAAAVVGPLALALAGLAAALRACRASPAVAGAVVTLLALAWLGWPVWLSPWLVRPPLADYDGLAGRLSVAHPLLALDAAVTRLGGNPWVEHRLMYNKLTVLGQHVLARPPAGVTASAAWHAGVGVAGLGIAGLVGRRRERRPSE
ncbi:MAG: hypothetical protein JWO31_2151, partial [Phycisphaerales bacterium]|nr:hypothetical protein [Phycisphaerales bacterium]